MGKQGQKWRPSWKEDSSSTAYWGSSWDYYGQQQQAQATPSATPTLIPYDKVMLEEAPDATNTEGLKVDAVPSAVGLVQKALNQARKAEARGKRIATELATAHTKWAKFQQEAKRAFLEQQSKYRQDIARLEKEALAAKLAAQEAQDKVREAVLQDKTLQPVNEKVKEEIADDGAWEALLASPMQVDEEFTGPPDTELLAFLQKTLVKPGGDKPVPTSLVSAGDWEELLRCQIRGLKNQLASQNAALLASTTTTSDAAERQVDAPSTPPMIRGPPRTPVVGGGRGSAMKPFYNSQATMRDPYQVSPSNNGLTIPTSSEMNQDGYQPIRTPLLSAPVKDMQGKMGKPGKGHSNAGKHAGLRASPLHPSASLEDTITARAMLSDGKGKTTGIQPSNSAVHIAIQDDDHDLEDVGVGVEGGDALAGME